MNTSYKYFGFIFSLFNYASLILRMTKHEVMGRYRGSIFGLLWSFVTPILMLGIYTFVFSIVFKARWGQDTSDSFQFAIILFVGLIFYNLLNECWSRAPTLIINNANYVKKVVFPVEVLAWISLGSALFHAGMSLLVLLIFLPILGYAIHWTFLLLPIVIAPFLLLIMGVSWLVASLGVFIRDINQVIGMLLTVLLFLCPIFYPLSALPEHLQPWLLLNPLTFIVEQARTILVWGELPDWYGLSIYFLLSLLCGWSGWMWFIKTRKGFADVL